MRAIIRYEPARSGSSSSPSPPVCWASASSQLRDAPVDVLPEFTPPYAEIQTEALGLSAEEVEELITVPLEADLLNGVRGRRRHPLAVAAEPVVDRAGVRARHRRLPRPAARPGAPDPGARLAERLQAADAAAAAVLLQPRDDDRAVLGASSSPIDRSVIARWTIRPRLMGVPGVANVVRLGHARPAAAGAGRPGAPARPRRHARTRSSGPPATRRPCRR